MSFRPVIIAFNIILGSLVVPGLNAQITQTIRGTVIDKNTGVPLIGATVLLLDHEPLLGTITDLPCPLVQPTDEDRNRAIDRWLKMLEKQEALPPR